MTIDLYPRLARVWLVGSVVVAAWSWCEGPTHLGLALVVWLILRALSVPTRRRLVEVTIFAAVAFARARGRECGVLAGLSALAVLELGVGRTRFERGEQPFVGFDLCHFLLTSEGRPSTSHHFLELLAPLDRARMTAALAQLIQDVSRLRTFVREAPLGVRRFVASSSWVTPESLVEWHESAIDPVDAGCFERPIDVFDVPPIRLFHAPRVGGGYLFGLTLHHSVADGTGAMLLLDGLLRRYDGARDHDVHIPLISSDGPRYRRLVWTHGLRSVGTMLASAARHVTRGVHSASLVDDESPRPASFHRALVDVPIDTWRDVVAAAGREACTPNHFLMAASLRAADVVRRARSRVDETFRVVVPSDLRKLFGLPRSLPNYIGTVPLDVTPDQARAPGLPRLIRDQMRQGRTLASQMRFPIQIGLLGLLPPALGRRVLRSFDQDPETFAFSFLFSHIRVPPELHLPANNDVVRLWCASSQGRQPAFGVAITTIGERTWALLQYLSPYVAEDTVEQFGRELLAALRVLTEEGRSS